MTNNENTYHVPVMLQPCLDGLNIQPEGTYVDVTFGGGGHSKAIFQQLNDKGRLIAFDQDKDALNNTWESPNFLFIPNNFEFLHNSLRLHGIPQVDGVLADLGVSSHQFDEAERGFSIRFDAVLDMRMNVNASYSALELVNEMEADDLLVVLAKYGEVKSPRKVAEQIVRERKKKKIRTTGELVAVLLPIAPKKKENQFLAQVFQAIRIAVNNELEVLEKFLLQTTKVLRPGGRLVVMTYHSLEDRLVKNFMKRGSFDGKIEKDFFGNVLKPFTEVVRKPIIADEEEIKLNPRARSAKLRIAERNDETERI